MSLNGDIANSDNGHGQPMQAVDLQLHVSDVDVVDELLKHPVADRNQYALAALKVGVLAIKQAAACWMPGLFNKNVSGFWS